MYVLSIDIDFFVSGSSHCFADLETAERLSEEDFKIDDEESVRRFLEDRCRLSSDQPTRGIFIRNHRAAYRVLECLCEEAEAHEGLSLFHVDAHADLGVGSGEHVYLLSEWLSMQKPRPYPYEITSGNWLAFACANGWISNVTFVPQTVPPGDLKRIYFAQDAPRDRLRFRPLPTLSTDSLLRESWWERLFETPGLLDVPFVTVPRDDFLTARRPDFVIVCQSPSYTTASADRILDILAELLVVDELGLNLTSPLRAADTGDGDTD